MNIIQRRCLLAVAIAIIVTFISSTATAQSPAATPSPTSLTKIRFVYDFFPSGNHTVLWATLAQGFFKAEGLDVSDIQQVTPNGGVASLVAGQADFAFADFTQMTVAIQQQNARVIAVMGLAQQTPMAILSRAEKPILTPGDMKGKTILDFAASNTQIVWPFFLEANRLSRSDVNLQLVDAGARLGLLTQGRADGTVGFFSDNVPVLAELCKCAVAALKWKDHGVSLFSNGIVARRDLVDQNPEAVFAFVRALKKGLEFVRANPEAGVNDLLKFKGKEIKLRRESVVAQTQAWLTLTTTPTGGGTPIGFMTDKDWQSEVDLLVRAKLIKAPVDIHRLFTNRFIPQK